MKKTLIKKFALFIVVILVLVNIPATFSKASQNNTTSNQSEDLFIIDKTAEIDKNREVKISLKLEDKRTTKPNDVILVMDSSGSMKDDLGLLKSSMNNLSKELLKNKDTRISVIKFASYGEYRQVDWVWDGFFYKPVENWYGTKDDAKVIVDFKDRDRYKDKYLSYIESQVNGVKADGGTNTEAALIKVGEQLKNSRQNANKYVVFFTDGLPTIGIDKKYSEDPQIVKKYITDTENEYNEIKSGATEFISVGLFNNVSSSEQKKVAQEFIKYMNTNKNNNFYIEKPKDIEKLYNIIQKDITKDTDVVIKDIVSDEFEIIEDSYEPKTLKPTINEKKNEITWNTGAMYPANLTVSFRVKLKDCYYSGKNIETNKEAAITYKVPGTENKKTQYFPKPTVNIPPLKGSITIVKEVNANNLIPSPEDSFSVNLQGGENNESYNIDLKSAEDSKNRIERKLNFNLKSKNTVLDKTLNYVTIGEYNIKEIIPMNYELTGIYVGTDIKSKDKFKLDKDNTDIKITIKNKLINNSFFYDKAVKNNEFIYNPNLESSN